MITGWRMIPPGGAPIYGSSLKKGLMAHLSGPAAMEKARKSFSARCGRPHVFLAGSGREALAALFLALRQSRNNTDTVLLPAYASYSLAAAVARAGCRAALYDLDPHTLAPDMNSVKKALSRRILAVVVAHQFGYPADTAPLAALCAELRLPLVDDAAQALGASVRGVAAGTTGVAGIFSLGRAKCITAVNGGVLAVGDENLAAALKDIFTEKSRLKPEPLLALKALGLWLLRRPALYRLPAALPWLRLGASIFDPDFAERRFTPFQAGMASFALAGLDAANRERARKADFYRDRLPRRWRAVELLPGAGPVYTRFAIMPRDAFAANTARATAAALGHMGISRGYPQALADLIALKPYMDNACSCPGARQLAAGLITLPTHDQVREKDCEAIITALEETGP